MNTSRDWSSIIQRYEDLCDCWWACEMCLLAIHLEEQGYVKAGLHGATSMHSLYLSQCSNIFENPRLKLAPAEAWFHGPIICRISYESGPSGWDMPEMWHIDVQFDELMERVPRLLTKRLRWFRQT